MAQTLPPDLLSVREAANVAGLHRDSVYRLIERGHLTAYGRPKRLRVSLADLLAPYKRPVNGSQPVPKEKKLNGLMKSHRERAKAREAEGKIRNDGGTK